jgi:hypothetical protein
LLQWQDPNAVLDIKWAAVTTGWGSEGDWVVCLPESCTGWHDGFEAKGVHVTFDAVSSDHVYATEGDGFTGEGIINFTGDETGCGADGTGACYNQNSGVESVTWSLYGCAAGRYDLGFTYSLLTANRPLILEINGVQVDNLNFAYNPNLGLTGAGTNTGVCNSRDCSPRGTGGDLPHSPTWGEEFAGGVPLVEGMNTVTLSAQHKSGPDIDFLEVNAANGRDTVSQHGVVHITADNGYTLFINGDEIGSGGAVLPADDPMYEADGWMRTDAWAFHDSCQTPTAFAVEAVDSEGVAAVIAEVSHCGFSTKTGPDWKCAVAGCTPGAATGTKGCSEVNSRTYSVIPTQMSWDEARQACRQRFPNGDLASIHTANQQALAAAACKAAPLWVDDDHGVSNLYTYVNIWLARIIDTLCP